MNTSAIQKSDSSDVVREEFGATQIERRRETAQSAMVAQATAQIQAQYVVARQNPRSWLDVRAKLLTECKRSGFAESAIYAKPQRMKNPQTGRWENGKIEGLSIRFAEAAQRTAGNIRSGAMTIYDDDEKRILNVYAIDLETNAILERTVTVSKVVERSDPKDRTVLAQRLNSAGEKVYLIECTDDELRQKESAVVSKEKRNLVLAIMPGDIREECERACRTTRASTAKADPDAERKRVADAFYELGVMPSDLSAYLGHDLGQTTPAELESLRGVYAAIREGEANWADFVSEREKPAQEQVKTQKATTALAEKIKARKGAGAPATVVDWEAETASILATIQEGVDSKEIPSARAWMLGALKGAPADVRDKVLRAWRILTGEAIEK